ncbi:MAG: glycosyltransferase [Candidatus Manganitrophaceae bacterium]|nr:MAG: glycosyltransferase [Candidatus Manganitrophaceae bacterium]
MGIKKQINVLFVIVQMEMGGAERLVCNIVSKLDRQIFNPSIAWFFGDKVLDEFKKLEVPLHHIPKVKRLDFGAMRRLADLLRRESIDVVNAHHFMPLLYSFYGCKMLGRKLVYTEHSGLEIEKLSWKWKTVGGYLIHLSDRAVGVSPAVSNQIEKTFNVSSAKTSTIVNGVSVELFEKKKENPSLKKEIGIKEDEAVIGMVANFHKIKNHLLLLKAFNEVIKEGKRAKLLLVGQGFESIIDNAEPEIRSFIAENGLSEHVLTLGYRTDVPALLGIMDIFCLTSFNEGLPIGLIEAMAAGLPVVGTDVGGIRDLITPNKNGFLVAPADVEGLKKALLLLIQDESMRKKLGQESRQSAFRDYSLDRCIQNYQNLFLSLC